VANLRFPRIILPIAALVESAVGFLASLGIYYLIVGPIDGVWPAATLIWLLPTVLIHLIFNFGLSTIVARVAVPFRDLNNLVPYLTRLWLYLSPIIYPPDFVKGAPEFVRTVIDLNPLYPLLSLYRYALLGMPVDHADALLRAGAWAVLLAVIGGVTFIRYEGKMARYL
jgi:ABC-type polysaccharide/polyol phosphate export permease